MTSRSPRPAPRMLAATSAALVLALTGCGDDDEDATSAGQEQPAPQAPAESAQDPYAAPEAAEITGALDAEDQSGDGSSFTVNSVSIEGSEGWIALHADADGAPGPVVGFVQVPEGESSDVEVKGEEPLESGDYWPMLHRDDGKLDTYEFGESQGTQDAPVTADGKPVMVQITYTAE